MAGIDSPQDALRVAALPDKAQTVDYNDAFSLAMSAYEDSTEGRQELAKDIEGFTLHAMGNHTSPKMISSKPVVQDPTLLMAYTALGIRIIEEHPELRNTPNRFIRLSEFLREEFARNVGNLVLKHNGEGSASVILRVAEHHYSSNSSKKEGHPGQVIETITHVETDPRPHLRMPLVFASNDALVYHTEESFPDRYDLKGDNNETHLASFVHNNKLYIPLDHLEHTNFHYLTDAISDFVSWVRETIKDEDIYRLADQAPAIHEQIDKHIENNNEKLILKGRSRSESLVQTIRKALQSMEDITVSDYHKASTIIDALRNYNGNDYEEGIISDFESKQRLSNHLISLAKQEGKPQIGIEFDRESQVKKYKIGDLYSNAEHLPVDEIEDLFELPCYGNLDERLMDKGPVRWELFSLVRTVWWLPDYHDEDIETVTSALKDVFERWPWYDPKETEYQVRYELTGTDNLGLGDSEQEVLPLNCNNERWNSNYCIGKDECPYYTMYSAIDFHDDLKAQLDQMDNQKPHS